MAIKKAILNKVVSGVAYEVYPKTSADIVTYTKGTGNEAVDTTVAAELAALATAIANGDAASLQAVADLRQLVFDFQDGETISTTYDTIREIAAFLDQHDDSIGQLASLITDVGHASTPESAEGAGDGVAATGIHADVEQLQADVTALQEANGTNVTKTYNSTAAANGHLFLDGVDTTVYDDSDLSARVGASTDTAAAAGTTAWSRIKNAEDDIDALENGLGLATDTADATGTTAWARIKALEAVEATKVEDGTTNGYIKVNGTDDAIQVYSDADLWASVGRSSDTAAAAGTTAWARIKNAEDDIDALEAKVGASTDTANASGTTLWSRVKNAEDDIDDLEAGLGTSADTADASGTTAWSRIKAIEAWEDQIQFVSALPASPSDNVLYMVEIQ